MQALAGPDARGLKRIPKLEFQTKQKEQKVTGARCKLEGSSKRKENKDDKLEVQ